jgi:hypothetical protein
MRLLGLLLDRLSNDLLSLSLDLGASFVIVGQVTSLAHAHRVQESIGVLTVESVLISPELSVAGGAHVFSVMLPKGMRALGDGHDVGFLDIVAVIAAYGRLLMLELFEGFFFWFDWLFLDRENFFLFIDKLLLDEVL